MSDAPTVSRTSTGDVESCDCGHPVSYHRVDDQGVARCGWNPPKSHRHCGCTRVTTTGVARDETYERL